MKLMQLRYFFRRLPLGWGYPGGGATPRFPAGNYRGYSELGR